ncbi:MAG: macro domain-containing protein [bacterium]|nr:MAG: macro domain-containing protein [bacterium]
MPKESEEARDERKRTFIAAIKDKKCRALIEPLSQKIQSFVKGEAEAGEIFRTAHYVAKQGDKIEGDFKKRPDVILAGIAMDENKYITEIGDIAVKVRQGDCIEVFTDAIVNPASPDGSMATGLAAALKNAGGETIEENAVAQAPITPGTAVATGAGKLPTLFIIHAPSGDEPGGTSTPDRVQAAVSAALALGEELELETVTVPGMGTGVGGLAPDSSAQAIIEAIRSHEAKSIGSINLVDRAKEMVDAFVSALERYDEENE